MLRTAVIALAFLASRAFVSAQVGTIRQEPPRPGDEFPRTVFIGRYGEVLEVPYGWVVDAKMHGETEVVDFHRQFTDLAGLHPFTPKDSDYSPEQMTSLGLFQFIAIPKDVPGSLRSLTDIRVQKEAEMNARGYEFKIFDEGENSDFPSPSFSVTVTKPYSFAQLYTQSANEFFILTTGFNYRAKESGLSVRDAGEIENAQDALTLSFGEYLKRSNPRQAPSPADDPLFFARNLRRGLAALLAVLAGSLTILAGWPGTSRQVRLANSVGRGLLLFPGAAALAGLLIVYLPHAAGRSPWKNYGLPAALAMLSLPVLAALAAKRLSAEHRSRILRRCIIAILPWLCLALWAHFQETCSLAMQSWGSTVLTFLAGITAGVAFVFTTAAVPEGSGATLICAFTAMLIAGSTSHAATIDGYEAELHQNRTARTVAREIVSEKNLDYHRAAITALASAGNYFAFQRVEVTGFMSNDDTSLFDPALFSRQIKPSFANTPPNPVTNFLEALVRKKAMGAVMDLDEVKAAMRGEVTPRARAALSPYKNAEINELVAHSWGSELVYAAIMNGELRPPKVLIVVGVPDDFDEKWELLAAHTGTKVIFARAPNDRVASEGILLARKEAASIDFAAHWDALCSRQDTADRCPAHGRHATPVVRLKLGPLPGIGHNRVDYYNALKTLHILTKTAEGMNADQTRKIDSEMTQVKREQWTGALQEARQMVSEARARWEDDLRKEVLDIARRICADEDVDQSEVDAIPLRLSDDKYWTDLDAPDNDCVNNTQMSMVTSLASGRNPVVSVLKTLANPRKYLPQPAPMPKIPAPEPLPRIPRASSLAANTLSSLAEKACKNPDALTTADSDWHLFNDFLRPSDANGIENYPPDLSTCGWSVYNQLIVALRSSRKLAPYEIANMAREALGIPIPQPAYVPRPRRDPDRDPDPGEDCFIATDGVRMCRQH